MECPNCKSSFETTPAKCTTCGYPFSGTDAERSAFIGQQVLKVGTIGDSKESLDRAKLILYFIAGVNLVLSTFFTQSSFDFVAGVIISLLFFVFGYFLQKKPLLFLILPLCLLLLLYTLDAIIDPSTLYQGLKLKVLYIGSLVYAIVLHFKSVKIKRESEYLSKQ
jgi:hypothetical protein